MHDLKDANVVGKIWTGVVPSCLQYLEPVSSDYNEVKHVPSLLLEHTLKTICITGCSCRQTRFRSGIRLSQGQVLVICTGMP